MEIHPVSGSIILNKNLDFVFDDNGDVLIESFKTLFRKELFNKKNHENFKNSNGKNGNRENKILSQSEVDDLLSGKDT